MRVTLVDSRLQRHCFDVDHGASIAHIKTLLLSMSLVPSGFLPKLCYSKKILTDDDSLDGIGYSPEKSISFLCVREQAQSHASVPSMELELAGETEGLHRPPAATGTGTTRELNVPLIPTAAIYFPELYAVLQDFFPEADDAARVLQVFLTELTDFGCESDEDALGGLACMGVKRIADLSHLDLATSQRLKERAQQEQSKLLPHAPVQVEVVPTDELERLKYLLAKEGYEVRACMRACVCVYAFVFVLVLRVYVYVCMSVCVCVCVCIHVTCIEHMHTYIYM